MSDDDFGLRLRDEIGLVTVVTEVVMRDGEESYETCIHSEVSVPRGHLCWNNESDAREAHHVLVRALRGALGPK